MSSATQSPVLLLLLHYCVCCVQYNPVIWNPCFVIRARGEQHNAENPATYDNEIALSGARDAAHLLHCYTHRERWGGAVSAATIATMAMAWRQ